MNCIYRTCKMLNDMNAKKSKIQSRTFIAQIDLLDSKVVLLVGDDFKIHKRNFISLAEDDASASAMAETMDGVENEVRNNDNDQVLGLTIMPDGGCMPFIFLKEPDLSVLVHELVHAVGSIMKFHGLKDEEIMAKMIEYLFDTFKDISMEKEDNENQN